MWDEGSLEFTLIFPLSSSLHSHVLWNSLQMQITQLNSDKLFNHLSIHPSIYLSIYPRNCGVPWAQLSISCHDPTPPSPLYQLKPCPFPLNKLFTIKLDLNKNKNKLKLENLSFHQISFSFGNLFDSIPIPPPPSPRPALLKVSVRAKNERGYRLTAKNKRF